MATAPHTFEDYARSSLVAFSGYIDPTWAAYPHSKQIAEALEDVESGATPNLMISCPPQHGKSTLASRNFPAWYLARHPDHAAILTSYGASYSALWGRRARDTLRRFGPPLFGVDVRRDISAADHWEIFGHRGVLHTSGVDGPVTGHPCDLFVCDDPIKTREEAESVVMREKAIEWWRSSVISRRPKKKVLIATRWHELDLLGWLLQNEPGEWRVLSLPALAESNDPLGRAPGDALCPAFLTREQLLKIKRTAGSYVWSSMWQQRPTPLGGGLFRSEHARRYRMEPGGIFRFIDDGSYSTTDHMTIFVTCDTATSAKTSADHTAIEAWGVTTHGRLVLLDLDLARIEGPEIMRRIVAMCAKWKTVAWIEENSTSKHLLSFMSSAGIPFRTVAPGTQDKLTRALPASGLWEDHRVVIPEDEEHAPWLPAFERQLYRFTGAPGGEDDAVDAFAYAARVYQDELGGEVPITEAAPNRVYAPSGFELRRPSGV